ncbi:hypothetical protein D3C86_1043050 [compost metagenome]
MFLIARVSLSVRCPDRESASWRSNGLRIAKPYSIARHSRAIKIGVPALRMEKVK